MGCTYEAFEKDYSSYNDGGERDKSRRIKKELMILVLDA